MDQEIHHIPGRACPSCGGPVCTYGERTTVHCQAGCGYQRSDGDDEAAQAERAAYVQTMHCPDCG